MQSNTDTLKVNQKLAQFNKVLKQYLIPDEIVEWIFPKSDNINNKLIATPYIRDSSGKTALHFAFDRGHIEIFEILLRNGADVLATDSNKATIAHYALESCRNHNERSDSNSSKNKYFIDTVLSLQMKSGNITIFCNNEGLSHFHAACVTNNVEAVDYFMKHGVSINHVVKKDSSRFAGFCPLHFASAYCNLEVTEMLLKSGANMYIKDNEGLTPVHIVLQSSFKAVNENRKKWDEMKKLLIANITNSDTFDINESGLSVFHIACTMMDSSLLKKLVKSTNIDHPVSVESALWPGYTALHFAVYVSLDVVKLLVKKGADLKAKDVNGVTPLDLCVKVYREEDIYAILSVKKAWKNILLSDKKTKLANVILAMKDYTHFSKFVSKLSQNPNVTIPSDSPLWPGITLLQLIVLLYKSSRRQYLLDRNVENKYIQMIKLLFDKNTDIIKVQDVRGQTPLHICFRLQKENVFLEALLEMHQQLENPQDIVDENNLSLLHIACAQNNEELVEELLASSNNVNLAYKGESVDGLIECAWTPLHIAVANDARNVIETLLKHGADIYAKDANGQTPIHLIVIYKAFVAGQIFFSTLSMTYLKDDVVDDTGLSHLHVACSSNELKAVKRLVDAGADVNKFYTPKSTIEKFSPLQMAVESRSSQNDQDGNLSIIKLLIERGASVSVKERSGSKAPFTYDSLYYPTFKNNQKYCASLLKLDENLFERVNLETGLTKLHLACAMQDTNYIKSLLDRAVKINAKTNLDSPIWPGYTPLHILVQEQSNNEEIQDIIQLMLNKGADVTLINAEQDTPLLSAYKLYMQYLGYGGYEPYEKKFQLVSILLNAQTNFSVNPASIEGITHFHVACNIGCTYAVEKYLEEGVTELNHPIDFFSRHHCKGYYYQAGFTPLHLAVTSVEEFVDSNLQFETIDLLLKHGADVNAQDSDGNTPLHNADRFEIFERIIRAGADTSIINSYGKRPFETFLKRSKAPCEDIKNSLRNGCYYNVYKVKSEEGFIASSLNSSGITFDEKQRLLSIVAINFPQAIQPDEMGRTVIHNIVSSYHFVLAKEYAVLIDQLSRAGFDVDDQDKLGRTALHTAVKFNNFNGISGLLMAGADVNIKDMNGQTPMAYGFEQCTRTEKNKVYVVDDVCEHHKMFKVLAVHVKKLQLCNLDVSEYNQLRVQKAFETIKSCGVEEQFFKDLDALENVKIKGFSISLRDLISETDAVADYPTMSQMKRNAIDKFFHSRDEIRNLREKFGEVAGIVQLQYKKAVIRNQLLEEAKFSLTLLSGFSLPDFCFHILVKFLANTDLKNLIASTI